MHKILIANRGEIARRVLRAAHGLGIKTAVVYSDADAEALFVHEADEAVHLPGTAATETYLNAELVLAAARRVGADAIHPGYGFLSENAGFAEACAEAGLTFIGPPAAAIRSMGDKVESKRIMAANDVPVLGGVTVTDDQEPGDLKDALDDIGLPAIIKASAGGGGRGMRIITTADDLLTAVESAQRESQSAFGDGTVFIERYLSPSRHIEIQVLADNHGQVTALFERECSIQRRHQKIVEEAPSPFVDDKLREQLMTAACNAARGVDYRGAGTVEFIAGEDGTFAFLEMNTRLQVEHPVTEAITGLDLVALQIAIADGERLGPEVMAPQINGHAIEVRLCAEDPAADYLPDSGTFDLFEIGGPGIRVDSGVASGSEVSPFYDSMVAKIIAHAGTRRAAAGRLADALDRARLHGVTTNRDLLTAVLRSEEFLAGDTTTDFLQRVTGLTEARTSAEAHRTHAAVAAIAMHHHAADSRTVQPGIPAGWRNNPAGLERVELDVEAGDTDPIAVGYNLRTAPAVVQVDGDPLEVVVHTADPGFVDATVAGVRRRYRVHLLVDTSSGRALVDRALVDSELGASALSVVDHLPGPESAAAHGGLTAPTPGMVVRVLVAEGDSVDAGQQLLVLEAMKMEHTVFSPSDGTIGAVHVAEGDQVESGAVLVEVTDAEE